MAGFAPSPAAAAEALNGKNKIRHEVHPGGKTGVKFSLTEVAKFARDGRNDPRLKGWVGRVLIAAGRPKGARRQAQAILDAFRKQTMYAPDPVGTEMIAKPHVTLCLDELGLCMPASDCDDRCVTIAAALMSIGYDVRIIGQAFGNESAATHVILSVYDPDERRWLKIDPSHETWAVGNTAVMVKREWTLDPMNVDSAAGLKGLDGPGDFVGIGGLPVNQQGLAQAATSSAAGGLPTYVLGQDTIPMAAPTGSIVKEQPGSPYSTLCVKQANGTWACTNGSSFAVGQLEAIAVTCPTGSVLVKPGLCVPPAGITFPDGNKLMPDGSYHQTDGSVLLADGTYIAADGSTVSPGGQVSLSVAAEIKNTLAAAEQMVLHPLDTAALGAATIGQGAGQIVSNTAAGFAQGVTSPTVPGGSAFTWIVGLAAAAAGVYLLTPIVKEVIATREEARLEARLARAKPALAKSHQTSV